MKFLVVALILYTLTACGRTTPEVQSRVDLEEPPAGRPEAPSPSAGREHVIWYQSKGEPGTFESAWIRETKGGNYELLATRPEVVVSDGRSLWAMRPSKEPTPGCVEGSEVKSEMRGIVFAPLGRGNPSAQIDGFTTSVDKRGERHHTVFPRGSFGDRVIVGRTGSSYMCGGLDVGVDSARVVRVRWATDAHIDTVGGVQSSEFLPRRAPPDAKLLEPKAEAGCWRVRHRTRTPAEVPAELRGIRKDGERIVVDRRSRIESDCLVMHDDVIALDELEQGSWATGAVRSALLDRAVNGPIGFAPLDFGSNPAEKAAALESFANVRDALPWPAPGVRDEVGDSLTRAAVEMARLRPTAAIAIYDRLIATSPDLARAWLGRGRAKFATVDLAGAHADLNRALKLDTDGSLTREAQSLLSALENEGPVHPLPSVEQLCRGDVRLTSMLAPFGVVDYASLADYSEQGRDRHWARLATGVRAKEHANSAFVLGDDWCSECHVDEETKELECAPEPFSGEPPPWQLEYCERRGYGHGGSLVCFARLDTWSPWYVSLIGGAEEGNDVQDAEVSAALRAWDDLLRRGTKRMPATLEMLGGAAASCPDGAVVRDVDAAVEHFRRAREGRDSFTKRYHLYLTVHYDPTHVEARLTLASALLVDGDTRGAYREFLLVRAQTAATSVLERIKKDPSYAQLASEPLFASIVNPSTSLTPCKVPERWLD